MPHHLSRALLRLLLPSTLVLAGALAPSASAAPAACGGVAQISDPSGDGHHASTDVLSGWFSEAAGRLQVVIRTRVGGFTPEHDDAQINGSGYVFLFTALGKTHYLRAAAPPAGPTAATFDYGTWTPAGGFASAGATAGVIETSLGAGTVTVDVPSALGLVAGTTLAKPFVLTYDGVTEGVPDWVDHAPGGTEPTDTSYGADYVIGSCTPTVGVAPGSPAPGMPTTPGAPTAPGGTTAAATTAVELAARARLTGGGTTTVTGRVVPAAGDVPVTLTRTGLATKTTKVVTATDGTFSARIPVGETTRIRATAGAVGSQTVTVTVRSTVRISVRNRADGSATVTGTVRPALPGRVLLLRTTSATASASVRLRGGSRFTFRLEHPRAGRYQAVFIPSGARAERSTSNTGTIR